MDYPYRLTWNRAEIDHRAVWQWLTTDSYWARGRPWEVQRKANENSHCLALLTPDGATAAFARVVTDGATFGWLADLFVFPEHRQRGLAKRLVQAVVEDPELGAMQRLLLGTLDAHSLYEAFGFKPDDRDRFMERMGPGATQSEC
jgi:predicted N-acetyltransferase YhbS